MTINYSYEYDFEFDFDCEDIARQVILATFETEFFPYEAEIGITFVDDKTIRDINSEYRDIDRATDVLSFPMIEYTDIDTASFDRSEAMYEFIDEEGTYTNPDTGEVMLGDIVLCIPKVYAQAKEYNHSVLREYTFLIAHSMLHLLGYDHIEDNERLVMEHKQNTILESLGITRD